MVVLDHVGIYVKNLEEARTFFIENLECKVVREYVELPERGMRYELLASDGLRIELIEEKGQEKEGLFEICFRVEDIEKFHDDMKKKGIPLYDMSYKPLPEGQKYDPSPLGNRIAYFSPETIKGCMIEIAQITGRSRPWGYITLHK